MSIVDVLQVGNFFVEIALGVLAVKGINAQQNHEERVRIFEIMQERGMLPTTQQVMSLPEYVQDQLAVEIEEKIQGAYKEAGQNTRQRALPAPKQRRVSYPRAQYTATVKDATKRYNPSDEAYTEEDDVVTVQRSNHPRRQLRREDEY